MINVNEMVIELDSTLEPIELDYSKTAHIPDKYVKKGTENVRNCIYGDVKHTNYMEYLSEAWKNHYGIVFSPDDLWFIVLNEIASIIKDAPEDFRHLFTDSKEKKEIVVNTGDPQLIDLKLIMNQLKTLVPSNVDLFVPKFTSSTDSSQMAFFASFADAMTPFYKYSMMMCGIPKVKILGDTEDWDKVIDNLSELSTLFDSTKENVYFDKVASLVHFIKKAIVDNDVDFWKNIFVLERCGSGGQTVVKGWITKLFREVPSPAYINNYPTCVAYVPYKNLDTDENFELVYGLFSSIEEDGFLINKVIS